MKSARHQAILDLIEKHPIDRQEDLLAHLREEGFDVTQATVSRDIRDLQLVKVADADGHYRYMPAAASGKVTHSPSRFEMIFRESVLKVDYAGHLVLVKCFSGMPVKCLTPNSGMGLSARFPATIRSLSSCVPRMARPRSASLCSSMSAAAKQSITTDGGGLAHAGKPEN